MPNITDTVPHPIATQSPRSTPPAQNPATEASIATTAKPGKTCTNLPAAKPVLERPQQTRRLITRTTRPCVAKRLSTSRTAWSVIATVRRWSCRKRTGRKVPRRSGITITITTMRAGHTRRAGSGANRGRRATESIRGIDNLVW